MSARTWTLLVVAVSAACGAGDVSSPAAEEAAATDPKAPAENTTSAEQDDPNNPWVLGYQFSGTPGTEIRVEWATRDVNYEAIKQTGSRPFGTADFNHEVGEDNGTVLATVFVEGFKIRAEIKSETGAVKIEVLRGRLVDPANPLGDIEVAEILDTGEASGKGGTVLLAAGKPFDEAPTHW